MNSSEDTRVYISRDDIGTAIDRLASEINRDYRGKKPLVLGVLIGSFIFLADLVRKLDMPLDIDFVRLSSYLDKMESSGNVDMLLEPSFPVHDRDVLIVEDIADTGYSLSYLLGYLKERNPRSVKLCVLADKPTGRKVPLEIDYKGFTVPDEFLIGYGLDYNSEFRNLPDLCIYGEKK